MQLRKTFLNKFNRSIRGNARKKIINNTYLIMFIFKKKLNAFHQLQKTFIAFIILYYFDNKRQLYVNFDNNKEFDYGVYVYYFFDNENQINSFK